MFSSPTFLKLCLFFAFLISIAACSTDPKQDLNYADIVEGVMQDNNTTVDISDTANVLDKDSYDPSTDSIDVYLDSLENSLESDSAQIRKRKINDSGILSKTVLQDANISNPKDSFTADIKKINTEEIRALKYNLKQLHDKDSILKSTRIVKRGRIDSRVWARISKSDQRLYLYIDGKIVDTFKVSTGSTRHETPTFDMQPTGPIFQKYTSKKYPGGNYNGLGNMPYVVFIKGGYAVHGTTRGNIPRLGTKASHGCVRVHPDNAKIFNELVRKAGLENTWVTIEE